MEPLFASQDGAIVLSVIGSCPFDQGAGERKRGSASRNAIENGMNRRSMPSTRNCASFGAGGALRRRVDAIVGLLDDRQLGPGRGCEILGHMGPPKKHADDDRHAMRDEHSCRRSDAASGRARITLRQAVHHGRIAFHAGVYR
jgi:hypothetical protein